MISAGQMQSGTPPSATGKGSGLAPNIASLLCYICSPITGIIFILIEKENNNVKFHAWQSTVFGVALFVIGVLLSILGAILAAIAGVLGVILSLFSYVVWIAAFIVWIICLVKAYQGEQWRIPIIGDFAAKKAGI